MRLAIAVMVGLAVVATALVPQPVQAQDWTSIRGIRVVANVRGKDRRYRNAVGRPIRRRLVEAIGPLVPSREFERAKKKLRLRGVRANSPKNLARVGLELGAEHIIDVYVKRRRRGAEIRTRIVDVATSEIAFEQRTTLKSVKREAKKAGRAIGTEVIAKLQEITNAYGGSVTASAPPTPPPPPPEDEPEDEPAPFAGDPAVLPETRITASPGPPPPPPTGGDPYAGIDDPVGPSASTEKKDEGGVKWFSSSGEEQPPPPTETASLDAPPPPSEGGAKRVWFEPPPPEETEPSEFVRVGVQGGAGVLRSYTLATNEGSSALSYTLDPLSMIAFDFELIVPKANVGLRIDSAFRPVAYSIDRGEDGTAFPSGLLIDFMGAVNYHAEVLGSGRDALKVIPNAGVRVAAANVEQHTGNIIPSATGISVFVGTDARYPINDLFEVEGGAFFGLVVAYDETPLASGNANGGFTAGGRVGMRVWVTPYLGITFDNVLSYDAISLSDAPERPLPPDEEGRISDASITIFDVRSSVGIAFRF